MAIRVFVALLIVVVAAALTACGEEDTAAKTTPAAEAGLSAPGAAASTAVPGGAAVIAPPTEATTVAAVPGAPTEGAAAVPATPVAPTRLGTAVPATPVARAIEANFRFLLSDEPNAIDDFLSLDIVVSRIGIQRGGESGKWLEFEPQVSEVDLTQLRGDNAQELWSGNLEAGIYSKVFIYVDQLTGVVKETGERVDVKLPSNKLHISVPFEVTETDVTSFVYDLTVVAAGSRRPAASSTSSSRRSPRAGPE